VSTPAVADSVLRDSVLDEPVLVSPVPYDGRVGSLVDPLVAGSGDTAHPPG
jgi:hypothetical protein